MKESNRPLDPAQRTEVLQRLAEPFPPEAIRWEVRARNSNRSKGKILPYANPRAYTDRLNEVVTAAGWSEKYSVRTLAGITRTAGNQILQTGKVLVVCHLTIRGIGTKRGTGESWADYENAMTTADAQALARACARFGLGRYLYDFDELWVPLDDRGYPRLVPTLATAPYKDKPENEPAQLGAGQSITAQREVRALLDRNQTQRIESYRRFLGDALYREILTVAAQSQSPAAIRDQQTQAQVVHWMEAAARRIRRIHTLARNLGGTQLLAEMERLGLVSTSTIPSLKVLTDLFESLETIAFRRAA